FFKDIPFYGTAIRIVDISRQILGAYGVEEQFSHAWFECRDMKKMSLVKPDLISGCRMMFDNLTELTRPQFSISFPFAHYVSCSAVRFDFARLGCVEDFLPGHIEPLTVITYIHEALGDETISDGRTNAAKDLPAVCDRSIASGERRSHAVKPQLHGPFSGIGLFIVKRDMLRSRIFRRGINAVDHG